MFYPRLTNENATLFTEVVNKLQLPPLKEQVPTSVTFYNSTSKIKSALLELVVKVVFNLYFLFRFCAESEYYVEKLEQGGAE